MAAIQLSQRGWMVSPRPGYSFQTRLRVLLAVGDLHSQLRAAPAWLPIFAFSLPLTLQSEPCLQLPSLCPCFLRAFARRGFGVRCVVRSERLGYLLSGSRRGIYSPRACCVCRGSRCFCGKGHEPHLICHFQSEGAWNDHLGLHGVASLSDRAEGETLCAYVKAHCHAAHDRLGEGRFGDCRYGDCQFDNDRFGDGRSDCVGMEKASDPHDEDDDTVKAIGSLSDDREMSNECSFDHDSGSLIALAMNY